MFPLTLTFDIPTDILSGLADGSLVRNGGVIQDTSGRVVMWLKELVETGSVPIPSPNLLSGVDPLTGVMNLTLQGINAGISMRGFAAVTKQLDQIQGTLSMTTAASLLSLGMSAIGFSVILNRVKALEKRLEKAQALLEKIDQKIDLGFYASFRAALELSVNAFTMSKSENRKVSAFNAINKFLEAEQIYGNLVDQQLAARSQFSVEYLLTLCLAYVAEARCYLELEEFDAAIRRFTEGKEQVRVRIEKYVDDLLTSRPLMYLHPSLKGQTDLSRLTKIYQWKDPKLDEVSVLELLRDDLFSESDKSGNDQIDDWIKSLPVSVFESKNVKKDFWWIKEEGRMEVIQKLPDALAEMESMVETNQRFNSYELEVKALSQLEMSFHEWIQLKPAEATPNNQNLMYVVPDEPICLV